MPHLGKFQNVLLKMSVLFHLGYSNQPRRSEHVALGRQLNRCQFFMCNEKSTHCRDIHAQLLLAALRRDPDAAGSSDQDKACLSGATCEEVFCKAVDFMFNFH